MMSAATTMPDLVHALSKEAFREGMSRLGAAVNIITTDGPAGRAGFTASAVCSVTTRRRLCWSASTAHLRCMTDLLTMKRFASTRSSRTTRSYPGFLAEKSGMDERFAAAAWTTGISGAPVLEAPTFHLIADREQGGCG